MLHDAHVHVPVWIPCQKLVIHSSRTDGLILIALSRMANGLLAMVGVSMAVSKALYPSKGNPLNHRSKPMAQVNEGEQVHRCEALSLTKL
jgi:hypothetical protein